MGYARKIDATYWKKSHNSLQCRVFSANANILQLPSTKRNLCASGYGGGPEETLSTLKHLSFNAVKGTQRPAEPALHVRTVFKYTL